jgi:hypothetical protein
MTPQGVRMAAELMNANRQTIDRARIVLETSEAEALRVVIDALYERATAR